MLTLLVLSALAQGAAAGDQDLYLSVPLQSGIHRLPQGSGQAVPFAAGLGIPFYGFHVADGDLYVPDRLLGAILRIDPQGGVHPVTAGGWLSSPVAIVPHPLGGIMASDLPLNTLVRVAWDGTQTLIHDQASSGGLLVGPGGLDFDPDGNLYVANNVGNTIVKVDPQGNIALWSASPLIRAPGGVAIDGAGNMFVAMWETHQIVRFRLDTGEATVFAEDAVLMNRPNDIKLSRSGGLLTSTRFANVLRIDALGQVSLVFQDFALGEIMGVSAPEDWDRCDGRFETYGQGTAGSGGFVPEMRAVYSPCPGQPIALEWRDFLGGAAAFLLFGIQPGSTPWKGGTLLVDLSATHAIVPLILPGSGPGAGDLTLQFTIDPNPAFVGLQFYFQTFAADPGAPKGVAFSNGLKETIGS